MWTLLHWGKLLNTEKLHHFAISAFIISVGKQQHNHKLIWWYLWCFFLYYLVYFWESAIHININTSLNYKVYLYLKNYRVQKVVHDMNDPITTIIIIIIVVIIIISSLTTLLHPKIINFMVAKINKSDTA